MEDILYTYHGQLYVNLTNQCPWRLHLLHPLADQGNRFGAGPVAEA